MSEYFHIKIIRAFQLAQKDMFRAKEHLPTPSELGDIAPNVRRSEVPKSEISYFEPPAGRVSNEKIDTKS